MTLQEIQTNMTNILSEYLKDTVVPEKYFFLDKEYFFEYQKLSYNFFPLSNEEKKEINTLSKSSFKNFEFSLINDSVKNNCNLKKFNETKSNKFKSITKEYLLYFLLKEKNSNKSNIQKLNFLYTYINYILEPSTKDDLPKPAIEFLLKDFFENYFNSGFSEDLKKKIDEDKMEVEKELRNKEVKNFKDKEIELRNSLNILKRYNFLFTKIGYSEKLSFYYQINKAKSKIFQDLLGVYSLPSKDMELFYRGQPNSRYDINASLSRSDKLSYFEDELYYEILSLKPLYFKEDKSVYENLITMQHFGLPTRLIDLSRNALISLYFACSGEEKKDGAVYVIPALKNKILNFDDKRLNCLNDLIKKSYKDIKTIEDYCNDCTPKDKSNCKNGKILKKSYIVKGLAKNERITNQSGDFIFVGIDDKSKCAKNISSEDVNVEKILIIDSKSKEMILQELKQFNIHTGTVYPDLQNMSSHLKSEFEKRDLPKNLEAKQETKYTQSDIVTVIFSKFDYKKLNVSKLYNNLYNDSLKERLQENLIIDILEGYKNNNDKQLLKSKLESFFTENNIKLIEKMIYRKVGNRLINIMDFIIELSDYKKEIVIIEKSFDWKNYFEYGGDVPKNNNDEWAMFKMEVLQITENGLIGYVKDGQKALINFDRFDSFENAIEYGELVAVFDYSKGPLLELV